MSEKDIAAEIERRLTADPAVQDLLLELYGRDPRGGGVLASGDLGVLRLPRWFPYA